MWWRSMHAMRCLNFEPTPPTLPGSVHPDNPFRPSRFHQLDLQELLDRIQSSASFEASRPDAGNQVSPHISRQDSDLEIV
ncbi:hypothetical protein COMA2_160116 [Candidatus Nitrospira nitrificans]|uniref:Uncharacterized protein n=1 Tax=Candidatus Nitrospira nitrificans TaxID=1742973 RepID=A0A0S4L988_9BACT|nr:hypothetical protein COMA2_160116 [Candidatus Nitrospira nitrificans]